MHPYATDSDERRIVPFFLAAIGILAALGLNTALTALYLTVPWWLDAPAPLAFYGILYLCFNRWLWRAPLLRTLRIVRTPDLARRWKGTVASSFDERASEHPVDAEIFQTWTRILVTLESEYSRSHSTIAGILADAPGGPLLTYEYVNEPKASAAGGLHMHRGVARLRLRKPNLLDGEYFTGRDRQNHGTLVLRRVLSRSRTPSTCPD